MRLHLFLAFCIVFPLMPATWVEDSLGLELKYPRGWKKEITRNENFLLVNMESPEGASIRFDSFVRNDLIDLDRYIEYRLDLMLKKNPDLKVTAEKRLGASRGFDDSIFIVLNFKDQNETISTRILFSKKANIYYSVQCRTLKKHFPKYRNAFDIATKSARYREFQGGKWRNDSLYYLDPVAQADVIQKILNSSPLNNSVELKSGEDKTYRVEQTKKSTNEEAK